MLSAASQAQGLQRSRLDRAERRDRRRGGYRHQTVTDNARGFSSDFFKRAEYERVTAEAADWLGGFNVLRVHADTSRPDRTHDSKNATS
jgi:hypothetical protein